MFSFWHALISVIAHWKRITPGSDFCPIHFTNLEIELHRTETELVEGLGNIMHQLEDEELISRGGMVRPEHFEHATETNSRFKEISISLGEDDQPKAYILRSSLIKTRDCLLGWLTPNFDPFPSQSDGRNHPHQC